MGMAYRCCGEAPGGKCDKHREEARKAELATLRRELAEARAQLGTASATNHEYAIAVIPAVGAWVSAHPGQKAPKLDEIVSWVCRQLAASRDENRRSGDRLMEQMAIDGKLASELAEARRDGEDLDWLDAQCQHQKTVPQFWRNRNNKVSFAPYDDAKCIEADSVRAAIRAARGAK